MMQGGEAGKNKILSFMRDPAYVPMKEKELVLMMQVKDDRRELFKSCLNDLLSEGRITKTKRGRYQIEDSLIVGTFISNRAGFGFVEAEGLENDLYIAAENTADAFLLDTVEAKVLPAGRSGRR
ncbi:MAG: ribonuclease R, partial [Lachnospiraceae bacterium]|nr:ribonuclease R [Lachnospiraceae bacterium]